jgi:restriction system protein
VPAATKEYIDGREIVEGKALTLDEWLRKLHDPTIALFPTIAFPTDEMRNQYLQTIANRSIEEVISLLRRFLIPTCTLDFDKLHFRLVASQGIKPTTEQHRRLLCGGPAWEGLTWTLDLLERSPERAIEVLDAYALTHVQALDRGWWMQRLYDAMALIRAKWIEMEHPEQVILGLGGRKFERLVARLFSKMGYHATITKPSHDGGVDIHATWLKAGQRHNALIQCKCSRHNVGVGIVRELHGAVEDAKVSKGILVSSQSFTRDAQKWAFKNPRLELVDRRMLVQMLNAHLGASWIHYIDFFTSEVGPRLRAAETDA